MYYNLLREKAELSQR